MAINPTGQNVDISNSGFMAIQPPTGMAGPKAKRKVVTGPDGTPHVVYVDLDTGQELQNLAGYNVVDNANYMDLDSLGLSPVANTDEDKETTAEKTIKQTSPVNDPHDGGERGDRSSGNRGFAGRSQANNFGYINAPTGLGLAGLVPGPIGTAAKVAKAGIGLNNNAAINSARGMLGLPDQGLGQSVMGVLGDKKGKVADVNINGGIYSVGLEALDKQGKTTMTPDEAAKRAAANKVNVQLATDDEIAQKEREFDAEFGKDRGVLGSFFSKASSFIDSIFGRQEDEDPVSASIRSQNSGSNFNPTASGFSDMIGATARAPGGKSNYGAGFNPSPSGFADAIGASSKASKAGGSGSSSGGSSGRSGGGASNPGTSGNMGSGGGTTSGHGPGIGSA